MSELSGLGGTPMRACLTRRSLVAAVGVLSAAGPIAASKALAFANAKAPKFEFEGGGDNCQAKCVMCFFRGTRLLTPDGEVAIERLRIGDLVMTESGTSRAIRWIGRITIDRGRAEPWPDGVEPIRVTKNAFGAGRPHRDLFISRAHLVHLNGVLIPVGDLINGRTIAAANVESARIDYFHVELGTHDVLVAEGAPCESLLLTPANLQAFNNFTEYLALYGAPSAERATRYAPTASFNGGRGLLKSRMRSALSPIIDVRRPLDVVRDDTEARSLQATAA